MTWAADERQPDGSWRRVDSDDDVRQLIRRLRRYRRDRGHLVDETRVAFVRGHPTGLTVEPDLVISSPQPLTPGQVVQLQVAWGELDVDQLQQDGAQ